MFKKEYDVLFEVKGQLDAIEKVVMELPKEDFEKTFSEIVNAAEKVGRLTNKFIATAGRLTQYHKALHWFGNYDLFCCIYTVRSLIDVTEKYLAEKIILAEMKRQPKEFESKLLNGTSEVKYYEKEITFDSLLAMAV